MSNLGSDLIFAEILPRLPAKSLMRFKCVSKPFNTQISSRDFTKLYLRHHSYSTDTNDLFVIPGNNNIACYDLNSTATSTATTTFTWKGLHVNIVGSTNGLLCINIHNFFSINTRITTVNYFSVVNPITRLCQDIPSPFPARGYTNLGFAFDRANLDFKLVGVVDQDIEGEIKTKTRITLVYSLNTNLWTKMETELPEDVMEVKHYGGGALINDNLLHWMFWSGMYSRYCRIGCFDVCKNKWVDDVLLPPCIYVPNQNSSLYDIGVLDYLLFSTFVNRVEHCFDVWVMKEYGVQDSWFKLFSIPISNDIQYGVTPVVCREGSAEVLIRMYPDTRLFWYNWNNGGISKAEFDGRPDFSTLQVYTCSRSLVDVPHGKLFEEPHKFPGEVENGEIVYDLVEYRNSLSLCEN